MFNFGLVKLSMWQWIRQPHPSSFDELSPEIYGGVVEGELLTAQVVNRWVALQIKEQVIVETNFFWLLLTKTVNIQV